MKKVLYFYHQKQNTRGVAQVLRNIALAEIQGVQVDTVQYREKIPGYFDIPATYYWEDYSMDEIAEIADGYDICLFSYFPDIPNEDLVYWTKFNKPVKIWINSNFYTRKGVVKNVAHILKHMDYIMTYSYSNAYSMLLFEEDPALYDKILIRRPAIAWNLYEDSVQRSMDVAKDLPYIIESGFWDKNKNSIEISKLLTLANEEGVRFDEWIWIHMGISFAPQVFFQHTKLWPEVTIKCGRKITNYIDPEDFHWKGNDKKPDPTNVAFLMQAYTQDFMEGIMSRSLFSYSLMTPFQEKLGPNKNIAPRFEYSQLEKTLYTIPILETNFLNLFDDMGDAREAFLEVDVSSEGRYKKSIHSLKSQMDYLKANEGEYKERRSRILRYIRENHTMDQFFGQILALEK